MWVGETTTDHHVLSFSIAGDGTLRPKLKSEPRFNVGKTDWESFRACLSSGIRKVEESTIMKNLNKSAARLTKLIVTTAKILIPRYRACGVKKSPW